MAIEAVIFDRDGVLTFFDEAALTAYFHPLLPLSLEELSRRWSAWGTRNGFPRSLDEEERFLHTFWSALSAEFGLTIQDRDRLLRFSYPEHMRPYPDAVSALRLARQRRLRVGVLSNFALASLERSLHATGLTPFIDVACAATVIGHAKPEPQAFEAAAQLLDVTPERCLFFDDEDQHVLAARQLGMRAYLVDRQRERHALEQGIVRDLSILAVLI